MRTLRHKQVGRPDPDATRYQAAFNPTPAKCIFVRSRNRLVIVLRTRTIREMVYPKMACSKTEDTRKWHVHNRGHPKVACSQQRRPGDDSSKQRSEDMFKTDVILRWHVHNRGHPKVACSQQRSSEGGKSKQRSPEGDMFTSHLEMACS